jgi:hypothetical protein
MGSTSFRRKSESSIFLKRSVIWMPDQVRHDERTLDSHDPKSLNKTETSPCATASRIKSSTTSSSAPFPKSGMERPFQNTATECGANTRRKPAGSVQGFRNVSNSFIMFAFSKAQLVTVSTYFAGSRQIEAHFLKY